MQQAVGIIYYKDGKLLVQEHKKTGKLSIPVGSVEPGETPLEALQREVWEELGVRVAKATFIKKTYQECLDVMEYLYRVELHGQWINKEVEKHPWMGELPLKNIMHYPLEHTEVLKSALKIMQHYDSKRSVTV